MISKYPKLSLLENIIQKGGLKLIVLTRLSPLFPFSILNYFYGLNNRIFNKNFINKEPKNVVDECKSKLKEAKAKSNSISKKLEMLS